MRIGRGEDMEGISRVGVVVDEQRDVDALERVDLQQPGEGEWGLLCVSRSNKAFNKKG